MIILPWKSNCMSYDTGVHSGCVVLFASIVIALEDRWGLTVSHTISYMRKPANNLVD